MKRFLDMSLLKWKKNPSRKPLILRGARQTGKTFSIRRFGKEHFRKLVWLDFERNPDYRKIFEKDLNPHRICQEISLLKNEAILPGETLLFFDEAQECPQCLLSLRYFYEEMPDLHVVASGSLLEFAFRDLSMPVGRVQFMEMHPMGFVEFLWALGKNSQADLILRQEREIPNSVHESLLHDLRQYMLVGGMPECVRLYSERTPVLQVLSAQSELCRALRMDFSKYNPLIGESCLNAVLSGISRNSCRQTKYTRLAEGYSQPTLKKAYTALLMARLVYHIPSVNPQVLPLESSPKIFKSCMLDVGLMNCLNAISTTSMVMEENLMAIYEGILAEQFVAQELLLATDCELYYWERSAKSSTAEVDFLFVRNGKIYPVEVKSFAAGKLKSLHMFLQAYPHARPGLVFSTNRPSSLPEQHLSFFPLYYAYSLGRDGVKENP
jgi:predicted AAA+ superfamily ATPase